MWSEKERRERGEGGYVIILTLTLSPTHTYTHTQHLFIPNPRIFFCSLEWHEGVSVCGVRTRDNKAGVKGYVRDKLTHSLNKASISVGPNWGILRNKIWYNQS